MAVIGRPMTSKPGWVLALASMGSFMIGLDIQIALFPRTMIGGNGASP